MISNYSGWYAPFTTYGRYYHGSIGGINCLDGLGELDPSSYRNATILHS